MTFRLFVPILAGATLRERALACVGALIGIALTAMICGMVLGGGADLPLLVAPMGASAVLLFAIPASPMAQPWPIVGGNTISALVGIAVARLVHDPVLATGLGVSLAITAMSLTRSLHPPGGAAALTAVLGGPAVVSAGYMFPLVPVAANSILLVAIGLCFHRLAGRSYPHAASPAGTHGTSDPPAQRRVGFQAEDIDAALRALDETFDIDRADLDRLLRQVELQAMLRSHRELSCADIMSRDVVFVDQDVEAETARRLLLDHNIRTLPVRDREMKLAGTVGLRELAGTSGKVGTVMSAAVTATAASPAIGLVPMLTDGRTHAAIIIDASNRILGLITQTDLLAATARLHDALGRQPHFDQNIAAAPEPAR